MKLALTFFACGFVYAVNMGLYVHGESAPPLLELMASAQRSIKIAIYEMNDEKVLKGLEQASGRGVSVSIIKDPNPLESACPIFGPNGSIEEEKNVANCRMQQDLLKTIRSHGGKYVAFDKAELCGIPGQSCFQHGKIAIFDDKTALISTGNFNDTNLCDLDQKPDTCNRDYSVVTDDLEIVGGLNAYFGKDLLGKRYDFRSFMTASLSTKLTVSPISLDNIIAFINSAKTSIQIQNQYLEEPNLNAALIGAAHRGVKIELMVSDVCNFKKPTASKHTQVSKTYTAFDRAGISSRMFNKDQKINEKSGYLHAKAIVVDGNRAWVGSMNGSTESATMNREYGIYFHQADWVSKLSRTMAADFRHPAAQTWKQSLNCQKANRESDL